MEPLVCKIASHRIFVDFLCFYVFANESGYFNWKIYSIFSFIDDLFLLRIFFRGFWRFILYTCIFVSIIKWMNFMMREKNITIPHTFENQRICMEKITEIKKFHRIVVHSFQANQYISNELCDIHHVNNGNQSIRLFFVCVVYIRKPFSVTLRIDP